MILGPGDSGFRCLCREEQLLFEIFLEGVSPVETDTGIVCDSGRRAGQSAVSVSA